MEVIFQKNKLKFKSNALLYSIRKNPGEHLDKLGILEIILINNNAPTIREVQILLQTNEINFYVTRTNYKSIYTISKQEGVWTNSFSSYNLQSIGALTINLGE